MYIFIMHYSLLLEGLLGGGGGKGIRVFFSMENYSPLTVVNVVIGCGIWNVMPVAAMIKTSLLRH